MPRTVASGAAASRGLRARRAPAELHPRAPLLTWQVGNQASEYCEPSQAAAWTAVRRDGSYIYEDFMHTNGTDVKVCPQLEALQF